jgi:hypothetical protein
MSLTLEQAEDLLLQTVNFLRKLHSDRWGYSDFTPETELDFSDLDSLEYDWDAYDKPVELHGRKVEKVEFDTGGEGHAEDIYMVVKTTDVDGAEQYWRKDGYYASYDGSSWDGDFREVSAVERVVTFYE